MTLTDRVGFCSDVLPLRQLIIDLGLDNSSISLSC